MTSQPYKPLTSVLVKPSGPDCNLNCSYCFYLGKAELFNKNLPHRMAPDVLEELIRQVMEQANGPISITWQGGEPTLSGLNFFRKAMELEMKYSRGLEYSNALQTNGMLLNKDWAQFLKENHWLVGISLDGPESLHNKFRLNRGGKGIHAQVEQNAKMLLSEGVEVNAMCCVTSESAKYPDVLYNYFKKLGLTYMQFIPVVEPDKENPSRAASFSVSAKAYGSFLCRIFDLWLSDFSNGQPSTSVRNIEAVFFNYVGLQAPDCNYMKDCGAYVVVEHTGDVYSCDFFVEPKWKLGNIKTQRIVDMLNSPHQYDFGKIKSAVPIECRRCLWYDKCYGGCPKDRIKDPEDHGKARFCKSYKMFHQHSDKILSSMARQWKEQRIQEIRNRDVYDASSHFMS